MAQAVVFEVVGERFALPIGSVMQVIQGVWPLRLGRAPYGCLGAVDLHGKLLPLLDAGSLLGLRKTLRAPDFGERLAGSHFLVVHCGGEDFALVVDRVLEIAQSIVGEGPLQAVEQGDGGAGCALLDPERLVGQGRRRLLARAVRQARPLGEPC